MIRKLCDKRIYMRWLYNTIYIYHYIPILDIRCLTFTLIVLKPVAVRCETSATHSLHTEVASSSRAATPHGAVGVLLVIEVP